MPENSKAVDFGLASVSELIESLLSSPDLPLYPAAQRQGGSRGHSEGEARWQRRSKASRNTAPSPHRGEAGGQGEGCVPKAGLLGREDILVRGIQKEQNLGDPWALVPRLTVSQLASPRYGWILLRN